MKGIVSGRGAPDGNLLTLRPTLDTTTTPSSNQSGVEMDLKFLFLNRIKML